MLEVLIGAASAAAITYAGYSATAPTSQLYGSTLVHGSNPRHLALTFDDGPNDPHTLRLLEVLARHDVKATFFLIGRYVRQRTDIARELAAAGHTTRNHTATHALLTLKSQAE